MEYITLEEYRAIKERKPSKWNAVKVVVFGIEFHSKHEAHVYIGLRGRQDEGEISQLQTQVYYEIVVNGRLICGYIADFTYVEKGALKVVDAKGARKGSAYAMFRLKKKLMLACYGVDVEEVYADGRQSKDIGQRAGVGKTNGSSGRKSRRVAADRKDAVAHD